MAVRADLVSRHSRARSAWLNFLALVVLAGGVQVLAMAHGGLAAGELRAGLPPFYYGVLPVLASIAVGMLSFDASLARHAVLMAVVATLLMVALDLVPPTLTQPEADSPALSGATFQRRAAASQLHGGGALRTMVAFARGDLVLGSDVPARYPADHPRLLAATAASAGGHLLLPAVLVGIMLGLQAWVSDHVTFRSTWDARLAHLLLSWVVAPATFFLIVGWVHRIQLQVLFGDSRLAAMLLPYIPFTLIAAIGWVTAWRMSRWTAG